MGTLEVQRRRIEEARRQALEQRKQIESAQQSSEEQRQQAIKVQQDLEQRKKQLPQYKTSQALKKSQGIAGLIERKKVGIQERDITSGIVQAQQAQKEIGQYQQGVSQSREELTAYEKQIQQAEQELANYQTAQASSQQEEKAYNRAKALIQSGRAVDYVMKPKELKDPLVSKYLKELGGITRKSVTSKVGIVEGGKVVSTTTYGEYIKAEQKPSKEVTTITQLTPVSFGVTPEMYKISNKGTILKTIYSKVKATGSAINKIGEQPEEVAYRYKPKIVYTNIPTLTTLNKIPIVTGMTIVGKTTSGQKQVEQKQLQKEIATKVVTTAGTIAGTVLYPVTKPISKVPIFIAGGEKVTLGEGLRVVSEAGTKAAEKIGEKLGGGVGIATGVAMEGLNRAAVKPYMLRGEQVGKVVGSFGQYLVPVYGVSKGILDVSLTTIPLSQREITKKAKEQARKDLMKLDTTKYEIPNQEEAVAYYSKQLEQQQKIGLGLTALTIAPIAVSKAGSKYVWGLKESKGVKVGIADTGKIETRAENIMNPQYLVKRTSQGEITLIPFKGVGQKAGYKVLDSSVRVFERPYQRWFGLKPTLVTTGGRAAEIQRVNLVGERLFGSFTGQTGDEFINRFIFSKQDYTKGKQAVTKFLESKGLSKGQISRQLRYTSPREVNVKVDITGTVRSALTEDKQKQVIDIIGDVSQVREKGIASGRGDNLAINIPIKPKVTRTSTVLSQDELLLRVEPTKVSDTGLDTGVDYFKGTGLEVPTNVRQKVEISESLTGVKQVAKTETPTLSISEYKNVEIVQRPNIETRYKNIGLFKDAPIYAPEKKLVFNIEVGKSKVTTTEFKTKVENLFDVTEGKYTKTLITPEGETVLKTFEIAKEPADISKFLIKKAGEPTRKSSQDYLQSLYKPTQEVPKLKLDTEIIKKEVSAKTSQLLSDIKVKAPQISETKGLPKMVGGEGLELPLIDSQQVSIYDVEVSNGKLDLSFRRPSITGAVISNKLNIPSINQEQIIRQIPQEKIQMKQQIKVLQSPQYISKFSSVVRTIQEPVIKTDLRLNLKLQPRLEQKLNLKLNQKLQQKLQQKISQKLETKLSNKISTRTSPRTPKIPKIVMPKTPSDKVSSLGKTSESEYEVFLRKQGKDISLGKKQTKKGAEELLVSKLRSSLAASGYLETGGEKLKVSSLNVNPYEFTQSKREEYRLVQRREKRLSAKPETKEIQYFKKLGGKSKFGL
jgi:hypothetical protein